MTHVFKVYHWTISLFFPQFTLFTSSSVKGLYPLPEERWFLPWNTTPVLSHVVYSKQEPSSFRGSLKGVFRREKENYLKTRPRYLGGLLNSSNPFKLTSDHFFILLILVFGTSPFEPLHSSPPLSLSLPRMTKYFLWLLSSLNSWLIFKDFSL